METCTPVGFLLFQKICLSDYPNLYWNSCLSKSRTLANTYSHIGVAYCFLTSRPLYHGWNLEASDIPSGIYNRCLENVWTIACASCMLPVYVQC